MKKIIFFFWILCSVLIVSGCVAAIKPTREERELAVKELICESKEQCALYWQRAQIWIARNSAWKIQTATDYVINTYTPTNRSSGWGFQVTREPIEDGKELIYLTPLCGSVFAGCSPDRTIVIASFKGYVLAGR